MSHVLQLTRGDSRTLVITASEDVSAAVSLIFTAKFNKSAPDSEAVIQKYLAGGLSVSGASVSVDFVYVDTKDLHACTLAWDLQAQLTTGAPRTVADGTLAIVPDVTQGLDTSVPVHTSQPPALESAAAAAVTATTAAGSAEASAILAANSAAIAAAAVGGEIRVHDLADVTLTSIADGDRLTYSSGQTGWKNSNITDAGFF